MKNAVGVSSNELDNVRSTFRARGFEVSNYQIDGVPLAWSLAGDSSETVADVAIYERVEFVRGATGLLTGAGDPSASINLVRKHADSKELTGYVNLAAGSWWLTTTVWNMKKIANCCTYTVHWTKTPRRFKRTALPRLWRNQTRQL